MRWSGAPWRAGRGQRRPRSRSRRRGDHSGGGDALASPHSVSTQAGGRRIVEEAPGAFGSVDVLINNAGIVRDRSLAKMNAAELEAVLDVHLRGSFHVTKPAFR